MVSYFVKNKLIMYIKYPVFSKDSIDCSYVSWYNSITATSSQCVRVQEGALQANRTASDKDLEVEKSLDC